MVERRWCHLTDQEYQKKLESAAVAIEGMRKRGENVETKDLVQLRYIFGVPLEYVPQIVRDAQALLASRRVMDDTERDARRCIMGLGK
jgi:hypothetical protein